MFSRFFFLKSAARSYKRAFNNGKKLLNNTSNNTESITGMLKGSLPIPAGDETKLLFVGFLALLALWRSVNVIEAGNVGVRDLFGKVDEKIYPSGLYIINPFASIHQFSIKTQNLTQSVSVPSKEGLTIHLEVSALYAVKPERAREIYTTIGVDFKEVVLKPHFLSAIRQVTSGYEAKDLYTSSARNKISHDLTDQLRALLNPRGIEIEDTPLREIHLPEKLTQAIEEKLQAEQSSQRMQFVLKKEELEAERKTIEARGIAAFQKIVSDGISKDLLRWKGIEATREVAESKNSKIIIVGGTDGLPIIFNASDNAEK